MKAPVLPMLLGISICGISGALIYAYLRKRDAAKKPARGASDAQTLPDGVGAPPTVSVEVLVRNDVVPLIVGREGGSLRAIEEKTKTRISFRDKDDSSQMCTISGEAAAVKDAQKIVKQLASRPLTITEEVVVPQSACGKIIGRCGEALQEICRKSQAKVSVESGDRGDGTKRCVMISGTQAQVNTAKVLIEEKVREDAEARRVLEKREPRLNHRSGGSNSSNSSQSPREVMPPKAEKLCSTNPDGQMEVYVSAIASPSKFWVQMIGPQCAELDHLVNTMTEYYDQSGSRELHKIREPYLGQIVAAMFKWDNKWYRAEVVAILPNEFNDGKVVLDIYFVDYGDSAYVETNEIFQLRTDFLTLRFQAIECFLANVKPASIDNSTDWSPRSTRRFEELTHVAQWRKLLSRVVNYREKNPASEGTAKREGSPLPGVELFDTTDDGEDINIGQELVAEGLATTIDRFGDAEPQKTASQAPKSKPITTNGFSTPSSSKKAGDADDTLRFLAAERMQRKKISNGVSDKS
ncbi:tudor and KH domain-containing protein homolog [Phlebotomus argentipes]|uniref:tudor and KH domain-containing protein homolog n=1 Tax=Phlebotomus argentipes TaxID=94469 RepID=UPI002892A8D1|nr:tudor and KH domain-containing protein homolog [Phlebotomus argentipes]